MLKSKVTERSQTTLPSGVRQALGLVPGEDSIAWEIHGDTVLARRAASEMGEDDPALAPFLQLLEQDLAERAGGLRGMPRSLHERLLAVTEGVAVDMHEPIEGSVAL